MAIITLRLAVLSYVSLFYCCNGALTEVDEAMSQFLGCASIGSCTMDEFFLASPVTLDTVQFNRYDPVDCINFCKNFAEGVPAYSFAGVAERKCYCFDSVKNLDFLKRKDDRCDESCPETASCRNPNLIYVYTVCPFGTSLPPSCKAECPTHCLGKKVGQKHVGSAVCDRNGRCVYGCKNNYCATPETCETLTGDALNVAKDDNLKSQLKVLEPGLYILTNKCFKGNGFVLSAEFYGRTQGSAYIGIWRPNGTQYVLQWKYKMVSDIEDFTSVTFLPDTQQPPEVQKDDCMGIHFDHELMTKLVSNETKRIDYTMLYAADDPKHGAGPYVKVLDAFDDGWEPGYMQGIPQDDNVTNTTGQFLSPSVSLTLTCECSPTCKNQACNSNGECTKKCISGFKGSSCGERCSINEYGGDCALQCSSGCRQTVSIDCYLLLSLKHSFLFMDECEWGKCR